MVSSTRQWVYDLPALPKYLNIDLLSMVNIQYTKGRIFSEGLAAVSIDGKGGYIDSAGDMIIEPQYDNVGIFSEGLAAVKVNEKWGYIDKSGNMFIAFQYADAGYFSEGLAPVEY